MDGWDEYLENTELVVSDSLATIQTNTDVVYQTLLAMGSEYGLSLTESLTSPWREGENAIQSFSEKFGISMSATVEELQKLAIEFKQTMLEIESAGQAAAKTVEQNFKDYQDAKYQEPKKEETKKEEKKEEEKVIKVGGQINAGSAKIYDHAGDKTPEKQYFSKDPIYTVLKIDGNWVQVRHHSWNKGITGWFKKGDVKAYASGTTGVSHDQFAWIDELGEELVLRPQNGRLTFMEKGSAVIPADMTSNLMKWGAIDPTDMLERNKPTVGVSPSVVNNTMEINVDAGVGTLIHIDEFNGDDPAEVTRIVNKALEQHTRNLNNAIKKYTR